MLSFIQCSAVLTAAAGHAHQVCWHAGIVTTLVTKEQIPQLLDIGKELDLKLTEQPQPPADTLTDVEEGNIETAKKNLDDLYNLL